MASAALGPVRKSCNKATCISRLETDIKWRKEPSRTLGSVGKTGGVWPLQGGDDDVGTWSKLKAGAQLLMEKRTQWMIIQRERAEPGL